MVLALALLCTMLPQIVQPVEAMSAPNSAGERKFEGGKRDFVWPVPGNGIAVMGKKRDIKYRITEENLKEVAGLQKQILETVWRYVKKGGTLTIAHGMSREKINTHHDNVMNVSNLLMDIDELDGLLKKYLKVREKISDEKMYLITAEKSCLI